MEDFETTRREIPPPEKPRGVEEIRPPFGLRFPEIIEAIVRKVGSRRSLLKRIKQNKGQMDSSTEK